MVSGPMLNSRNFPSGLDALGSILQLSLAGLDYNDPFKTQSTLQLYMAIISRVPLFDPADLQSKPEVVFLFPEWTTEVINKMFAMLLNLAPAMVAGSTKAKGSLSGGRTARARIVLPVCCQIHR